MTEKSQEPTFKSNPNPGKLNTSFWESAFKKDDTTKPKKKKPPKKVNLYGKSFYDDKDKADANNDNAADANDPSAAIASDPSQTENAAPASSASASADAVSEARPKELIITDTDNGDDNKDGMVQIQGNCNVLGCKCERFIENPSKWMKGKCKSCDHPPEKHKAKWVRAEDAEPPSPVPNNDANNKPIKPRKTSSPAKPKAVPKEPEPLINEWGEEFTEKLKECVKNTFDFEEKSILEAKYLLHYLKKRIGFEFKPQKNHRGALRFVLVEMFGHKVESQWGFNVCVLQSDGDEQ